MINELCKEAHQNAKTKGFFDGPKNIGEMIALMHSELSEALEADRKERYVPKYVEQPGEAIAEPNDGNYIAYYENHIKGSFEEEMADIAIRVFDMCGWKGIDLEAHIKAKMRYNSLRPHKHGKKY